MEANAVFEKVKEIIVEKLEVKESEVTLKAKFVEDLGADSLDLVEMVMALEDYYEIEISDEDAGKLISIGDVVDYIQRLRGEVKRKKLGIPM